MFQLAGIHITWKVHYTKAKTDHFFFSYEWKEDTQEFVSNLFVTQIVNDNGIEKRIEVYPSMPVICKIVDFDVSTEFIVNDKETSG